MVESELHDAADAFLSVEEAQTFFEDSFAEQQTRSGDKKKRFLDPGEYTPQWEDAQTSQNDGVGSVDVPILPEYKYRAIRSEFKNGKAKAYVVELSQKLVVVKNKKTKGKAKYMLSLIPDRKFAEKNKNNLCKKFLNSGDKGGFSGFALYTTLTGAPVRLNRYVDGDKKAGVSVLGVSDQSTFEKRLLIILRELSKMKFQCKETQAQTRWGGEDDYWDALEDWANENGIEYNEYDDAADFYDDNPDFLDDMVDYYGEPKGGFDGDVIGIEFQDNGTVIFDVDSDGDGVVDIRYDQYWVEPDSSSGDINGNSDGTSIGDLDETSGKSKDPDPDPDPKPDPDPDPDPKPIAPNAKEIFRNSNMTDENWKKIENMINKIMADCMGGNLYNSIDIQLGDGTVAFQFEIDETASWNGNTLTMNNFESNVLFHEMFHIYQGYQETANTYNNSLANLEVETKIAQYMYLSRLPEFTPGSKWAMEWRADDYRSNAAELSMYLNPNGTIKEPASDLTFNSLFIGAANFIYDEDPKDGIIDNPDYVVDYSRDANMNLKNISTLSKGC